MDHKRGDSFDYVTPIQDAFADGYFVGWSVASEVRHSKTGALVATLTTSWENPATTRSLRLLYLDTTAWPIGPLEFDVQFVRASDGYTLSTSTVRFNLVRDVTQGAPTGPISNLLIDGLPVLIDGLVLNFTE